MIEPICFKLSTVSEKSDPDPKVLKQRFNWSNYGLLQIDNTNGYLNHSSHPKNLDFLDVNRFKINK